jgi:class III poly(R)-hydroxyalkanoic acid synthase PhaE subunit
MAEPESSDNRDWIQQWVEQQRLLLQQSNDQHHAGTSSTFRQQAQDLGNHWLDLGQAYLNGLHQAANGGQHGAGAAAGIPFQVGTDFISAWRNQWQSSPFRAANDGASGWTEAVRQLPPLGLAREHHATLRELADAHADCQRLEQALRKILFGVQTEALDLLERRVRERQADQALTGFRELYDLWVDCGEQVYAQVAHSEAYCQLQAQLGNAAVQLRARQQKLIEHALKQFDLPTRSELNSVHRQLREQAQQLRLLKEQLQGAQPVSKRRTARSRSSTR